MEGPPNKPPQRGWMHLVRTLVIAAVIFGVVLGIVWAGKILGAR